MWVMMPCMQAILSYLVPSPQSITTTSGTTPPSHPLTFLLQAPALYLHRFLRITPAYAFVIWCFTVFVPYLNENPIFQNRLDELSNQCKQVWKSLMGRGDGGSHGSGSGS